MTLLKHLTKSAQFSSKLFNQQTLRSLSTTAGTQPDVAAFIARLKLNKLNPALINNILERGEHIDHQKNGQLKQLGLQALDLFVTEKYMMEYPRLNRKFLEQILDLNFSQLQNSKLVQSFGFDKLLTQTVSDPADLKFKASKSFLSLIGAIYEQQGALEAREFIESYVTPRNLKIEEVLEFEPAKVILSQFVQKMGKEQPVTRLLKESGRLSNRPIFIVGVFSGTEKLSEGYGSSLKMAEYRACKNYLVNFHSKKRIDFELPSNAQDKSSTYKPSELEPTPLVL